MAPPVVFAAALARLLFDIGESQFASELTAISFTGAISPYSKKPPPCPMAGGEEGDYIAMITD
jgi:hypothetical protein